MIIQPRTPDLITDGKLAQAMLAGMSGGMQSLDGMGRRGLGAGSPPPSRNTDPLSSVISSACCDLDATLSSSYDGSSQTWSNIITSPADGASQSDYNFTRGATTGASTDDPTFVGTANDPAAYFSFDGGDYFLNSGTSSVPTIYNMHKKTGGTNAWWVAIAYFHKDSTQALWGRGWVGNIYGVYLYSTASNSTLYQDRATTVTSQTLGINVPADSNALFIVSVDMEATSNNVKVWYNSDTASATFNKTWTSVSTNTTSQFGIGCSITGGINGLVVNGTRIYHWSCGNELLNDTKAAAIRALLASRHERSY